VNALIFVAVASSFYATIASHVPSVDTSSKAFRTAVAPLNAPPGGQPLEVRAAVRGASTDAYHLAMFVAAGLLLVGAAVNGLGIRNPSPDASGPGAEQPPPDDGEFGSGGPVRSAPAEGHPVHGPPRTGPAFDPAQTRERDVTS
jgi:hypothetical protein